MNNQEALQFATDLSADRFIGFSTWKWIDVEGRTGGKPVYPKISLAREPVPP